MAGVESRPSAEIVLQDRAEDQRPHPLRTSISTPTMHERAREEIFPNVPNERPGKNGPDPSTAESQLGFRDRGERSGQGTVAEQPPAPIENTLDGDCVGGEAPETVKSEFPDGERLVAASSILVRIDYFQLQREAGMTERFGIPLHVLRRRCVDSGFSNPSYLPFVQITRCGFELFLRILHDEHICRKSLPSGTRPKTSNGV